MTRETFSKLKNAGDAPTLFEQLWKFIQSYKQFLKAGSLAKPELISTLQKESTALMNAWPTNSEDTAYGEMQKILCEDSSTIAEFTSSASESLGKVVASLDKKWELEVTAGIKTAKAVINLVRTDDSQKFQQSMRLQATKLSSCQQELAKLLTVVDQDKNGLKPESDVQEMRDVEKKCLQLTSVYVAMVLYSSKQLGQNSAAGHKKVTELTQALASIPDMDQNSQLFHTEVEAMRAFVASQTAATQEAMRAFTASQTAAPQRPAKRQRVTQTSDSSAGATTPKKSEIGTKTA